jgi:ABC-type glycerol-3-phosphate transport system permease component
LTNPVLLRKNLSQRFSNSPDRYTLSIAVANLQGQFLIRENQIMTAALLVSLPVVITFLITRRYFIS